MCAAPSLPPIAGREADLQTLMQQHAAVRRPPGSAPLAAIRSGFACALHMHQPTIPAGADGALISHLQWMFDHPGEGDNHNAEPFAHCYRRLAELLPELIHQGCDPRIMLDYSGTLLWGFEQMGRSDILSALRTLTCDPLLIPHVEWLGSFWGHAVAPSTPIPDLLLQIQAWQHHFAALFGEAALQRIRGFSPPEMALPNHPDTLHAFVSALRQCGYQWLLVQEHSVENPDGTPLSREQALVPNLLVARSSSGAVATITALIKTQGSDTKLVGQMQPYYEALSLERLQWAGHSIPPLVTQIADGENGGVMMNEFPPAFLQAHQRLAAAMPQAGPADGTGSTVALNGSEYLELLAAHGVRKTDLPRIQAVQQHRLWQWLGVEGGTGPHHSAGENAATEATAAAAAPTTATATAATAFAAKPSAAAQPNATAQPIATAQSTATATAATATPIAAADLAAAITALQASDGSFSMAGASWTNNLSWVEGYSNVLEPMQQLSARFHQRFDARVAADPSITASPAYQQALLHLLLLETSCFRYWGQGTWTDYAREIHRRGMALVETAQAAGAP
ncbi:MAG: glycosyl hydrolase family 57 [Vulcanococcus sp.]